MHDDRSAQQRGIPVAADATHTGRHDHDVSGLAPTHVTGGPESAEVGAVSDTAGDGRKGRDAGGPPAGRGDEAGESNGAGSQASSRTYPAGHKTPAEGEGIEEAGTISDGGGRRAPSTSHVASREPETDDGVSAERNAG